MFKPMTNHIKTFICPSIRMGPPAGIWVLLCILLPNFIAAQDFKQAVSPREWHFPRDHGNHGDYSLEWWYSTSIVTASDGKEYGIHVTFFRHAWVTQPKVPESVWSMRDIFFAHFAVSDLTSQKLTFFEKRSRSGPELAGSDSTRLNVWLDDWKMVGDDQTWSINIAEDSLHLDLQLIVPSTPLFQGKGGLSQKTTHHASYYYSYPRMQTSGHLSIGNNTVSLEGFSWFDHEFSDDPKSKGFIGWDWFGLRLDDGTDLMIYFLRDDEGVYSAESGGTWYHGEKREILSMTDIQTKQLSTWRAESGARYPLEWLMRIPHLDLEFTIKARHPNHELETDGSTFITYWEGAVSVQGIHAGRPINGEGYMELTGYAHPL